MTLSLTLFLPVIGAVVAALTPRSRTAAIRAIGATTSGAAFAAALPLWFRYNPQSAEFQFVERLRLLPRLGVEYFLGADGYTVLMLIVVAIVCFAGQVSAFGAKAGDDKRRVTSALLLQAGLFGAVQSLDFSLFAAAWLLMLAAAVNASRAGSHRAPTMPIASAVLSAFALLAGIGVVYFANHAATGIFTFDVTAFHKLTLTTGVAASAFAAFLIAFLAAVPVLLFVANASTTTPSIEAAALAIVPLYGFYRLSVPMLPGAFAMFGAFLASGCLAVLAAVAVHAWREERVERLAAHWIIAQTAVVLLSIVALNETAIAGGMVQQLSQTLAVPALAIGVASATRARRIVVLACAWMAIGLPGALAFIGVKLVASGVFAAHPIWFGVAAIAWMVLASRIAYVAVRLTDSIDRGGAATFSSRRMPVAVATGLCVISIAGGVAPGPVQARLKIAAHHVASHITPSDGTAAECDMVPTPEQMSAAPGSQFLLAVPCGPDGQPLTPASTPP